MQIDIHADDYGLTANTSKSILEGINAGKLNSTSVMPNMEAFSQSALYWVKNLKEDVTPRISVHLNFMEGQCISPKEMLPHLVDDKGLFHISWGDLVKYNFNPFVRKKVKKELKCEIKAQTQRVADAYNINLQSQLRIDSHQHTHMIPIVLESIVEAVREEGWGVSYIRITKEVIGPYFSAISLWGGHELINIIKVIVLNTFAVWDKKVFNQLGMSDMVLSGVFFSGKMSLQRVQCILPKLIKQAKKRNCNLEILFHPGIALGSEMGEEFNHPEANVFYLSKGRQMEYEAMMQLDLQCER